MTRCHDQLSQRGLAGSLLSKKAWTPIAVNEPSLRLPTTLSPLVPTSLFPIAVTKEQDLQNVLCAFSFDSTPGQRRREMVEMLYRVSAKVRDTRATNSLVDFCYTCDGRLGACINLKGKVWDIAPLVLILPEAGGKLTDPNGRDLVLRLDAQASEHDYAVLGANPTLHAELVRTLGAGNAEE